MRKASFAHLLYCILLLIPALHAIDNAHFYRATYFWQEPRFEKKHLTSFDISVGTGTSTTGQDSCGHCVELFDIYGFANLPKLGEGVPQVDAQISTILNNVIPLSTSNCFGLLSIPAQFHLTEIYLNIFQNFSHGFFMQANLPIRKFQINKVEQCFPNPATCDSTIAAWNTFLDNFDEILQTYNLSLEPINQTSVGDLSFMGGLTCNYEHTQYLDFIDTTLKAGLLIPTGHKKNQNQILDIASGYDGHMGFEFYWTSSMGVFDWISVGLHASAILFAHRNKCIRIRTSKNQHGIIKLASVNARVSQGNLWELGTYFKADHFAKGLSLLLAYTFNKKRPDKVAPINASHPGQQIINDDIMLDGWKMHTLNLVLEYDINREQNERVYPRIQFFFNKVLGGRRIFNTRMLAGDFGIDLAWRY